MKNPLPLMRRAGAALGLAALGLAGLAQQTPAAAQANPSNPQGRYVVPAAALGMTMTIDVAPRPAGGAGEFEIIAEFVPGGPAEQCGGQRRDVSRYLAALCEAVYKEGAMLVTAEGSVRAPRENRTGWLLAGVESFAGGALHLDFLDLRTIRVTLPPLDGEQVAQGRFFATRQSSPPVSGALVGRWSSERRGLRLETQLAGAGSDAVEGTIAFHPGDPGGAPTPLSWPLTNAVEIVTKLRPFAIKGEFRRMTSDPFAFRGEPRSDAADPEIGIAYWTELRPLPSGNVVARQWTDASQPGELHLMRPLAGPLTTVPPPPGAQTTLSGVWTGAYHGVDIDLEATPGAENRLDARIHAFAHDGSATDMSAPTRALLEALADRISSEGAFAMTGAGSAASVGEWSAEVSGGGFSLAAAIEGDAAGSALDLYLRRTSSAQGMDKPFELRKVDRPIRPIPQLAPPPAPPENAPAPVANEDGSGLGGVWRGAYHRLPGLRDYADLEKMELVDAAFETIVDEADGKFVLRDLIVSGRYTDRELEDSGRTFAESFDELMVRYRPRVPDLSEHLRLSGGGPLVAEAIGRDARLFQFGTYELAYLSADEKTLLLITDRYDWRDFLLLSRVGDAPRRDGAPDPDPDAGEQAENQTAPPSPTAGGAPIAPGERGPVCAALFAREATLLANGGTEVVQFVRGVFAGAGLAFGGSETEEKCATALAQLDAYIPPAPAGGATTNVQTNVDAPTFATLVDQLNIFLDGGGALPDAPFGGAGHGRPGFLAPDVPDPCVALGAYDRSLTLSAGVDFADFLGGLYVSLGFDLVERASPAQCYDALVLLDDYGVDPRAFDGGLVVVDAVVDLAGPPARPPARERGVYREPSVCRALFAFESELLMVADTPLVQIVRGVFVENGLFDNPEPTAAQCASTYRALVDMGADPSAPDGGYSIIADVVFEAEVPIVDGVCETLDRTYAELSRLGGEPLVAIMDRALAESGIRRDQAVPPECEAALRSFASLGMSTSKPDGGLLDALAAAGANGPRPGRAVAFDPTPEPFPDVVNAAGAFMRMEPVPAELDLSSLATPALVAFLTPAAGLGDGVAAPPEASQVCLDRRRLPPIEAIRAWASLSELMRGLGAPAAILAGRDCVLVEMALEAASATLLGPEADAFAGSFEAPILDRRLDAVTLDAQSAALARDTLRAAFVEPPVAPAEISAPWRFVVASAEIVEAVTGERPGSASVVLYDPRADEVLARFRMSAPGER